MPIRLLVLTLSVCCFAQSTSEEALRLFLKAYRTGDRSAALAQMSANPVVYGVGGSTLPVGVVGPRFWNQYKGRILYLRHLVDITPESAVGILLWRDPAAQPGYTAGTLDIFLRKEKDVWKVFSWREALMIPPKRLPLTQPAPIEKDGWRTLFDGKSIAGWTTIAGETQLPEGWQLRDGILSTVQAPRRWSLRTEEEFTTFELRFQWRAAAAANSGVLYQLFGEDAAGSSLAGIEYQIADDDQEPGAKVDDRQKSGAQYGVTAVLQRASKPIGQWNESRILLQDTRCEHWLNGVRTAEFAVDGIFASPILLQHHGPGVDFRNIQIRTTSTDRPASIRPVDTPGTVR